MKKICIICKQEKILNDFYTHKQMADGKLNKCKDCCKKQQKEREQKLRTNLDWVEKERKRGREKAKRLYSQLKPNKEVKVKSIINYKLKFPEKQKAKNAVQKIKVDKNFHKHHWSYNKEHYKDYILIESKTHALLHRYLIYDQERMMYRRIDNLTLLDSKENHTSYMNYILEKYKNEI